MSKLYYYVHTGHRVGLDKFRRSVSIIRSLGEDIDITLLCSDFRIAHVAKEFGIKNSVGIDVIRNIPYIAHHGDKLIFDSDEANPIMLDDMRKFFSTFIRLSDDKDDVKLDKEYLISPYIQKDGVCNALVIDDKYFEQTEKTVKISFFYGDDDYEKDLERNLSLLDGLEPVLQLGFYYFLDYEDELKKKFIDFFEFEDYDEMIQKTEILITASPQAALENLASGGKPIYIQRIDYPTHFEELFGKFGIPIIKNYNNKQLVLQIETINKQEYKKLEKSSNKITKFIKDNLNL